MRTLPHDPGSPLLRREPSGEPASLLERLEEPGVRDVRDRLLRRGASNELCETIVRAVLKRRARGAWAIDAAAQALGRAFPVMPSPRLKAGDGTTRFLVFVGPAGGGKTACLAKLWRRLAEMERRVVNASLDAGSVSELLRVGGAEADVDRTEIPLAAVRDADDLRAALRRHHGAQIALVDTPGIALQDELERRRLEEQLDWLAGFGPLDVLLVLPANLSASALARTREAFARLRPTACVLTKLDETEEPLVALEEARRGELPIAFLCDGMDVRAHLVRPTAARFADLALRGRYA